MEVRQNDDVFREKEWFRAKIREIINNLNNVEDLESVLRVVTAYLKMQKGEI